MDEQLRANPDDLAALMRAGRLSPERVAMAAYLGDERALKSGLKPWEPPTASREHGWWPARTLVEFGGFSQRQAIWLAGICSEHAIAAWCPDLVAAFDVLERLRHWCLGTADANEVGAALERYQASPEGHGAAKIAGDTARAVSLLFERGERWADHGVSFALELGVRAASRNPNDMFSTDLDVAEQGWQAQVIAAVLLDPDWPPWDESLT